MSISGKITVELDYEFEGGMVRLSHPDLGGDLLFRASSEKLAQVQLDAINLQKPKTPIEQVIDGGKELIDTVGELRQALSDFRQANGLRGS